MIHDCIIIGGGVAGLSAANQLVDLGVKPLIVEASKYPSQRVCGEFFSHECLPVLERWEIPLTAHISRSRFYKNDQKIEFTLPMASGSCSRFEFDQCLLDRAIRKGAQALTETTVLSLGLSSENYELTLSNGKIVQGRNLIIGTGRVPRLNQPPQPAVMKYVGFKAHFKGIPLDEAVEIHTFPGGYLGISHVNAQTVNIACLVKKEKVEHPGHPDLFLEQQKSLQFLKQRMSNAQMLFPKWLITQIPEFGIRQNPDWERVFWIGDAAGSIPPVCGEGLAIAVTSGSMAADYLVNSNSDAFKKAWKKKYQQRFFLAKQIHRIMIHPQLAHLAISFCRLFPNLPPYLWKLTRE